MSRVSLTVNGKAVTADVDPRTLLVQFLRENLRLTGTHVGCDTTQCGCCVVHVNGRAIKSCTILLLQAVSELIKRVGFLTGHLDEPFPLEDGKTDEERLAEELAAQAEQLRLAGAR